MTLIASEADRLAAIDALIDAHDCNLTPDTCPECDRLWGLRADAHETGETA